MDSHFLPLQTSQVQQPRATINRAHILFHSLSILALIYYRLSSLYEGVEPNSLIPWLVITASELLLSFLWVLSQAFRWRPVIHSVFLDRLPCDELLPAIDVFICTADPNKEPPLDVMNTVISAMCLDYPPEKLSVYLSDDAGAPITLFALRESFQFAKSWVPFCKRYGIMTICPEAYFSQPVDDGNDVKFMEKRDEIKLKYNIFKQSLENAKGSGESYSFSQDRPPFIEVIRGSECDFVMPLLVYVSREKRPSHPHNFKAGALNSLLRVSGVISNAPFVLALDCDMYCNDPTSARQAMCFHLDPQVSPSLAFVQFPQAFHNMSNNDIYNGLLYWVFKVLWHGMNGLKGPILSGTGFYLKRQALFRTPNKKDLEIFPTKPFSPSDEFLASLHPNDRIHGISSEEQTGLLTSCTYEKDTQWGEEIGFMYHSVVEDYFTGFRLHCKGWNSIYRYPSRPAFLGSVTTNLNDTLVQTSRWMSGLLQVGLSRFCPLIYGPSRMCILQSLCYAYIAFLPLGSFALLCYAFVPQIFLLYGIPLYPKVSNSWFAVFLIVYLSSNLQYMLDVLTTGGSFKLWWNQNRISMVRTVTSYLYACLDIVMKLVGTKEIKFIPTNKVSNEMKETRYNLDVFDFQDASIFLLPLTTIVNLNIASLLIGISRAVNRSTWEEMFGQILISLILVITGYPIIDGMIIRKDSGRIPISVTLLSVSLVTIVASASFCY